MDLAQLRFTPLLLAVASAVAVALGTPARAQQPETLVPVVEGPTIQLHYGARTSGALMESATDIDLFTFDGLQGETVRIAIQSTSVYWDPKVQIVEPGSNSVVGPGCAGGCCSYCSSVLDLPLTVSGQYLLIVTDNGLDEGGTYDLELDRLPTSAPIVLQCNSTVSDTIQTALDTDFFEFQATAGAWIRINVQSTSVYWDPRFELFAPDGTSLHVNACGGGCCSYCSFMIEDTSLPATGIYRVFVTDSGFDEGGSYQFTLQFIIGGCPAAPEFSPYCFGDGTGTACPCGPAQNGAPGHGCKNSAGTAGLMSATGSASVSNDSVQLQVADLPPVTITLYFQGTGERNAGFGIPFGDGLNCVSGTVVRLASRRIFGSGAFGAGVSSDPLLSIAGSVPAAGGTRYYQLWYRNAADFCTASTFNLTNGLRIAWRP